MRRSGGWNPLRPKLLFRIHVFSAPNPLGEPLRDGVLCAGATCCSSVPLPFILYLISFPVSMNDYTV